MNNAPDNPNAPESQRSPLRAPSPRVTAALAAAMLGVGVAVGAAIGPAPSASFAVGQLVPLLPSLVGAGADSSPAAVRPPPVTPQATPSPASSSTATASGSQTSTAAAATPAAQPEATAPSSTTPSSKAKTTTIAPVTHVWLVELAGSGFGEATAQASAAPYINGQALPAGTLLSGWSGLDGGALAGEAALLAQPSPQLLDTIVQPPCPEGATGAQCAPGTPGALTTADEFLKATVPTITSTAAYRENGLIVVTFATIASATATGLPAGASTATLTAEPPAGVLLISPFAAAGARSSTAFDPTSPKQSLEKLLRR
jgi:hypothetical protein